ncbi:MAG: SemiSWEET transporter [Legionellales bacterium]|nr:SemiSWEET transporter [Legionellales bacterium]
MLDYKIIGYLAAICTTISFLPQVIYCFKTRSTGDISLSMYSVFNVGISLWLIYGISLGDYPMIIANTITLFFTVPILMLKCKNNFNL